VVGVKLLSAQSWAEHSRVHRDGQGYIDLGWSPGARQRHWHLAWVRSLSSPLHVRVLASGMGALALFPPTCACILGQHATVLPLDDAAPTHMCCRKEAMHTVAPISNYSISPITLRVDIRVGALHIAWLVARISFNVACD
jgi:hypothetical protein